MPSHADISIRDATPADAEALTAIAFAAKRHWDYPEEWIESWSAGLTISAEYIVEHAVFVAEIDSTPVGVCALELVEGRVEMTHLWVLPDHMRRGIGRKLFHHSTAHLRNRNRARLTIIADPHAEEFYIGMGAKRVGEVPSPPEGRLLPELEYRIE